MKDIANIVLLDYGSGGRASHRLIADMFLRHFDNPILRTMDDAARLELNGPLAMSTDSYVVDPIFFSGGNIGSLAVHGTINDVAMLGARPRYISCAFILEEGFSMDKLEEIVATMGEAARKAGVDIVTGDTKVVPRGACDKIFINTTGVGEIIANPAPSGARAQQGDAILVSGSMGDHGLTILSQRQGLNFAADIASDSAALNGTIARLVDEIADVHVLRDPTRGGLATTLNEIAGQSNMVFHILEDALPVRESVRNGCSFLGLDPLYLANEGKLICIVPEADADKALAILKEGPHGEHAARIGTVLAPSVEKTENQDPSASIANLGSSLGSGIRGKAGQVIMETPLGGHRLLSMLEGEQLPRIC